MVRMKRRSWLSGMAVLVGILGCDGKARAADPRDGDLRTLYGYFPFQAVGSPEAWRDRSAEIRLRVKVAAGLWPEPAKCPLNAVVHGCTDMGDYTIEKVFFESMPGHFVTGNLYRPKSDAGGGRRPAVLVAHGHWINGRFMDAAAEKGGPKSIREWMAGGEERFEGGARSKFQATCVQLARMGCVAFVYDMLGNADSIQFPVHRRAAPPDADVKGTQGWLLGGAVASGWLQSRLGIQTWSSVRALDFLLGLPDVDPDRIAMTGGSGGATQTMMLTAVDGRARAAFPAVMVSTAMQGGCACENAIYLRINQGNIDIGALAAPRPLGLTAADDWTKELETKGHPDLLALYKMLGAGGNYEAHFNTQFKHNYNQVSRSQFFSFINRHFKLGFEDPVVERDFEFQPSAQLTVWDAQHPAPTGGHVGDAHERSVCKWWADDAAAQVGPLLAPKDAAALAGAREVIGGALSVMIGRRAPTAAQVEFQVLEERTIGGCTVSSGTLLQKSSGEEVRIALLKPPAAKGKGDAALRGAIVWLDPGGADGLVDSAGAPTAEVGAALAGGWAVAGVDVHRLGAKWNRRVYEPKTKPEDPWQRDPILTYGYNAPLFVQRVHDVMTAVAWLRGGGAVKGGRVRLMAARGAGHWAAAAAAVMGDALERSAIDVGDFRFAALTSPWHADFLPGAAKYGDVGGMLVLVAPGRLWLTGVGADVADGVQKAYAVAGATSHLALDAAGSDDAQCRAVDWLKSE